MSKGGHIILPAFALLLIALPARGGEIVIDDFARGLAPGWTEKIFSGKTKYEPVQEDGRNCLKATSNGTASGLYYRIRFDPKEYPLLTWSWKVTHVIPHGDARYKNTDDYAARVYVVFPSIFFWNTRAINYIWANKLPKGEAVPNSYTADDVMIAVESGSELTGNWLTEQRNIVEDYQRSFGGMPGKAGAIAIMTDTDNTKQNAEAFYGPIRLRSIDRSRPMNTIPGE